MSINARSTALVNLLLQSSAIITRSNIASYYLQYCGDWDRTNQRLSSQKRHHTSPSRAFGRKWTALYRHRIVHRQQLLLFYHRPRKGGVRRGLLDSPSPSGGHPPACLSRTWFPEYNYSLLVKFDFKFYAYFLCGFEQKPIVFRDIVFKMATGRPYWNFCFLDSKTLDCLWISTSNSSNTLLVSMGRIILIFRNMRFNITAWHLWWVVVVSGPSLALDINPNFSNTLFVPMDRSLLIPWDVRFQTANRRIPICIFNISTVWKPIDIHVLKWKSVFLLIISYYFDAGI